MLHIKREIQRSYTAPDGLISLDKNRIHPGYGKGETTWQDNSPLFLAYYLMLCEAQGIVESGDYEQLLRAEALCTAEVGRRPMHGLYHRNPGRSADPEAFDNYVGWVAASVLNPTRPESVMIPSHVVHYGSTRGYCYNNVQPNQFRWEQWRQPGEVAWYRVRAEESPGIHRMVWLGLSVLVDAFISPEDTSSHLTMWLRLKSCQIQSRARPGLSLKVIALYAKIWNWIWDKRLKDIPKVNYWITRYFGDHPLSELSRGVSF